MKTGLTILLLITFSAFESLPNTLCDLIYELKSSKKINFNNDIKDGFVSSAVVKLNQEIYNLLFDSETSWGEGFAIGKIKITDKRIGIISYVETYEGEESLVRSYFLHIVENCKIKKTFKIMTSDSDVVVYEISSKLSPKFKYISIKTENSNDLNTDSKYRDTIFF